MTEQQLNQFVEKFLAAWNSQEVERVAACYTDDLFYVDPNTRGAITNQDDFKRYLAKLLGAWDMEWNLREAHLFEGDEGGAFLWRAVIKKPGGEKSVELNGMDLIQMDGDQISRNEVYFDRSALLPLMQ